MDDARLRNREGDDPEEDAANVRLRKRVVSVICGIIIVMNLFVMSQKREPILPEFLSPLIIDLAGTANSEDIGCDDAVFAAATKFQQNLWNRIIAIDLFCIDPTRKSEQSFWDTYRGRESDWYKEYRMSQSTFNDIVRDCVPFLYSRPTYLLESARFCYIRSKVVIATLIRYLAIQSDQHTLGKEFRVRQPCVSKRLERACQALLSAYWFQGCPKPKIAFPLEEGRQASARWFFAKCQIPFLCGSIDGSIIIISAPHSDAFIPKEFWCKRKKSYSLNLMVICDHRKRFIFADSRWPGSTSDTGAVSRSSFLTNQFIRRDPILFPGPYMILSDGGFHKRSCFIAPDYQARNRLENLFNTSISRARCVVENAFGLLKMKWRRLHQHSIAESTRLILQLVLCACVLHNVCIDAGDVNEEEEGVVQMKLEGSER